MGQTIVVGAGKDGTSFANAYEIAFTYNATPAQNDINIDFEPTFNPAAAGARSYTMAVESVAGANPNNTTVSTAVTALKEAVSRF